MEITESKLKDIMKEQSEGFQRHVDVQIVKQREEFQRVVEKENQETRHLFGIMKEDFDSKVQLIGEQYGTIKEMMGTLAEEYADRQVRYRIHKGLSPQESGL